MAFVAVVGASAVDGGLYAGVDKGLAWYINWVKGWADYPRMYVGLIILVTFCRTLMVMLFKIRSSLLAWQQNLVRW